jgi:hypothetical protein
MCRVYFPSCNIRRALPIKGVALTDTFPSYLKLMQICKRSTIRGLMWRQWLILVFATWMGGALMLLCPIHLLAFLDSKMCSLSTADLWITRCHEFCRSRLSATIPCHVAFSVSLTQKTLPTSPFQPLFFIFSPLPLLYLALIATRFLSLCPPPTTALGFQPNALALSFYRRRRSTRRPACNACRPEAE